MSVNHRPADLSVPLVEEGTGPLAPEADAARSRWSARVTLLRFATVGYIIATFVVVVAIWQLVVDVFHIAPVIVPSPAGVARAIGTGWDVIPGELGYTMLSMVIGFVIAVVAGVVCALLVTEVGWLRKTFYPLIVSFQSMPHIGLAPLLIVWFGFGIPSHAALAAIVAFFPVFSNMAHGLETVRGERVRLFRSYGASRLETIWKLKLPMSMPFFFAGANVGIIFAMLAVIVAEFIASNHGMGFLLVEEGNNLDTPGVFAVLVVLAVVGLLLHAIVVTLRRVFLRWL